MSDVWIGTSITESYVKKAMSFLSSLNKFHQRTFCVCYGFQPDKYGLGTHYKNIQFHHLNRKYTEISGMIQWGVWLKALPSYKYEDIYIMSDADMLIQRSLTQEEKDRFLQYDEKTVGACVNTDNNSDLEHEAISLNLRKGFNYNPKAQLVNCGVMVARPKFFETLTYYMESLIPVFNLYTKHRSRCQFLICHIIDRLNLKIDLLNRTFHAHGHGKTPKECSFLNPAPSSRPERKVLYEKQIVMFSHHFERLHLSRTAP